MKVYQLPHVNGNFGDALNAWLWRDLLPEVFDDDASVHFVGIGTILDRHLPRAPLTVVLGTGTGYAPPPDDLHADPGRWRVYGVRGPLTARILGLPDDAVLTDPAILLATHPAFRERDSGGVVFVPHWKSVQFGQWREACDLAGIEFVDPCGHAHAVIRKIAGAKRVIAESMHAGIIADAFRVPWVPVVLSREVAPFKWVDWASTVRTPYQPLRLGPSSPVELLRDQVLRHSAFGYIGAMVQQPEPDASDDSLRWSEDQLLRDHAAAISRVASPLHWRASVVAEALLKRVARAARRVHSKLSPTLYSRYRERAAHQLHAAAHGAAWLSNDAAHHEALERCQHAMQRLAQDHRSGQLRREPAAVH
jgi:succinoglycan biosynthesis protein ExoV